MIQPTRSKIIFGLLLLIGLLLMPLPAFSQEGATRQNLLLNGGFEEGFQGEFGVGYSWGGFSNGNSVVGWNDETWGKAVFDGDHAQMIEIKEAVELNRYAGIYQTIAVVPGQQYKLTISGLIRSEEGDIEKSDYGYRLQYAVDHNGGNAWELLSHDAWLELPWDEQPLYEPLNGSYRFDTFETTITATSDSLTLFVRGWKKWLNNGSGIFDLDEISFVGPAPGAEVAPAIQAAAGDTAAPALNVETAPPAAANPPALTEAAPQSEAISQPAVVPETDPAPQVDTVPETAPVPQEGPVFQSNSPQPAIALQTNPAPVPQPETLSGSGSSNLPVAGQGSDNSVNYLMITGALLLLVLFTGAVAATRRQARQVS